MIGSGSGQDATEHITQIGNPQNVTKDMIYMI